MLHGPLQLTINIQSPHPLRPANDAHVMRWNGPGEHSGLKDIDAATELQVLLASERCVMKSRVHVFCRLRRLLCYIPLVIHSVLWCAILCHNDWSVVKSVKLKVEMACFTTAWGLFQAMGTPFKLSRPCFDIMRVIVHIPSAWESWPGRVSCEGWEDVKKNVIGSATPPKGFWSDDLYSVDPGVVGPSVPSALPPQPQPSALQLNRLCLDIDLYFFSLFISSLLQPGYTRFRLYVFSCLY